MPLMLFLFLGWELGVQIPRSRAMLDHGPIPIQECGSPGLFGGEYAFLDVEEVSGYYLHHTFRTGRFGPLQHGYLYEMTAPDGSRWLVYTTSHAPESRWLARLERSGGQLTGMTSALNWDWAGKISAGWPYQLQPEEVRRRYGGMMLRMDDEPPAPLEGQELTALLWLTAAASLLWVLGWTVFWFWANHPMEKSLRAAEQNGLADWLLEDWAGASPFFKKRELWLGKRFLFIGGLTPFFIGYDEISKISCPSFPRGYAEYILENKLWPARRGINGYTERQRAEAYAKLPWDPIDAKHRINAPMLVVWLKDGRKLTLGTSYWPSGAAYAQDRALLRDYVEYRMQNPPAASPSDTGTAQ